MRKTATVTVDLDGRDNGKQFLLTEMPASQGEKWAMRAMLALTKSGVDVPEEVMASGWAGIAILGIKSLAGVSFGEAEPLMDEMFRCVQFIPNPANPSVIRPLIEDDIDEIATRAWLRGEVLHLHTGFSINAVLSDLGAALQTTSNKPPTPNPSTSPETSPPSSQPRSRRSAS
jgi:hypothetical protein